ncbi:MAG: hypothetical protein RLZZ04_2213 [Cyanobacteriota bacterium]|jgi:hypothetical protein
MPITTQIEVMSKLTLPKSYKLIAHEFNTLTKHSFGSLQSRETKSFRQLLGMNLHIQNAPLLIGLEPIA